MHPSANAAFHFYNALTNKFNKVALQSNPIPQVLFGIQNKNNIMLIHGFENAYFNLLKCSERDDIMIYTCNLTDDEIELKSWSAVCKSVFSSIDPSVALSQIHQESKKSMPNHITYKIFGNNKLTEALIAKLANFKCHSTVAKQKQRNANKLKTREPLETEISYLQKMQADL